LDNVCATLTILKINILWLKAEATGFLLFMYWMKIMRYALEFHTSLKKFLYSQNVKSCWISICLIAYNNLLSSANHNLVEYLSIKILNYNSILVCFYYWAMSSMKALTKRWLDWQILIQHIIERMNNFCIHLNSRKEFFCVLFILYNFVCLHFLLQNTVY
jgi:hypothetical protein